MCAYEGNEQQSLNASTLSMIYWMLMMMMNM